MHTFYYKSGRIFLQKIEYIESKGCKIMHVYPVRAQISPRIITKNDKLKSNNPIIPVTTESRPIQGSGVILTFTGNDKNIHQFASYAPENKRYGVKPYNLGGLGVVAQEAPENWRLKEGADVRDFSPYHSFNNGDGGITVAKLTKDNNGKYNEHYPAENFISAKQNETLEDVAKRVTLKEGEELAYVIRIHPDHKELSQIIRLEDTGIKGSFTRPANDSITKTKNITYRLFKAADIPDTAETPVNKYKKKIYDEVVKSIKEGLADNASLNDESNIEKINNTYNERLNSEEVQNKIKEIKAQIKSAPEVKERNAAYFIHTEDLAKFDTAYGAGGGGNAGGYGAYGAYGAYGTTGSHSAGTSSSASVREYVSTNVAFADSNRAFVEILPQLNTEAHGYYNPGNIWLHDRPAFMIMNAVADKSHFGDEYYNGLKIHSTFHNPGRDYQGAERNPFEFFRMVANKEDIEALNKHPQVAKLKEIEAKWWQASKEERSFVNQIMRPFMANFIDDYIDAANEIHTYNISMTPVAAVKMNPKNMSCGTVSINYGKEMKSPETPDIAQYMTNKLAQIQTIDITNGSTPANLRLNDPTANFCQGTNINDLTKLKAGFTPYEYKPVYDEAGKLISDNIEEVLKAKKANTKWLMDSLGNAFDRGGSSAVTKMFFTDKQISNNKTSVTGYLSQYKEGDILLMGWGRPDPQKGYPSTFQAFLDFLKDPAVDSEVKKHTKLIVGAGVWDEHARDYTWVKNIIKQIEELDGGIYKGNACYVNGFFPNRLVGCATYSIFTSRFEPCGITPLESFAAGTPVISTKTGGAPDFIEASRGYLTEHPYLRNPKDLNIEGKLSGKTGEEIANIIDAERMFTNAAEIKKCIISATSDYNLKPEEGKLAKYAEMARDCLKQKIDWHENAEYNLGKSANERYMIEVFETNKEISTRNCGKLERLVGELGVAGEKAKTAIKETAKNVQKAAEQTVEKTKNKWVKTAVGIAAAFVAIGTGAYMYIKKHKDKTKDQQQTATETNKKEDTATKIDKAA